MACHHGNIEMLRGARTHKLFHDANDRYIGGLSRRRLARSGAYSCRLAALLYRSSQNMLVWWWRCRGLAPACRRRSGVRIGNGIIGLAHLRPMPWRFLEYGGREVGKNLTLLRAGGSMAMLARMV